jgi:hypothetical protein
LSSTNTFSNKVLAKEPYPLLAYSLLREADIEQWVNFVLMAGPLRYSVLHGYLEKAVKRINARCQDLLQVRIKQSDFEENKVEFLHRTVRDFLHGPEMSRMLSENVGDDFQPHDFLCRSFSAVLRSLPPSRGDQRANQLLEYLLHHAQKVERDYGRTSESLIDKLEEVAASTGALKTANSNFLEFVVSRGLLLYGARKIINNPSDILESDILLERFVLSDDMVVTGPYSTARVVRQLIAPAVHRWRVKILESGQEAAATTRPTNDSLKSPWSQFLGRLLDLEKKASEITKAVWFEIAETMLKSGADPNCWIERYQDVWNCRRIFNIVFDDDCAAKLVELLAEEKQKDHQNASSELRINSQHKMSKDEQHGKRWLMKWFDWVPYSK